jgi:hypothetical protein
MIFCDVIFPWGSSALEQLQLEIPGGIGPAALVFIEKTGFALGSRYLITAKIIPDPGCDGVAAQAELPFEGIA